MFSIEENIIKIECKNFVYFVCGSERRTVSAYAEAGTRAMNGHGADMPMEVFSAGTSDLDQLVMFVVDATRPFSSPAKFE